jgi:hypothetical protein
MSTSEATNSYDGVEYSIKELNPGHGRWEWRLLVPLPDGASAELISLTKGEVQGTRPWAEALAKEAIGKWLAKTRKAKHGTFTDT